MSDKLRQGIAIVPEFVEGEQPSPAKLNSLGLQLRRAAEQLEKAVGDTQGQSWPYSSSSLTTLGMGWSRKEDSTGALSGASERFPDIVNIARLIGPASNLNPRMLGEQTIVEDVPVGVHEFSLRYPVDGTSDTNPTFSDTVVFATRKNDKTNLQVDGDYYVGNKGKVYVVTASAGGTAEYTVNPNAWSSGLSYTDSTFNVIPDPNQIANGGSGLAIGAKDVQGRYPVVLPMVTHQQSNVEHNGVALDNDDINSGAQLKLPKVLTDNLTAGDQIPSGFLVMKNVTTNELFDDAEYFYNGEDSVLVGAVELDDQITAGDSFVLITVGTDITSSIDDLRVKSFHTHDRSFGEPFVALDGISGFLEEAGASGVFVPSDIPGNFAPQYLHRDGWVDGEDANLNDENAMRGPLYIGRASGVAGTYTANLDGASFPIYLGTTDTFIRRSPADHLNIENSAASGGNINLVAFNEVNLEAPDIYLTASGDEIRLDAGSGNAKRIHSDSRHDHNKGISGGGGGEYIKCYSYEGTITTPGSVPGVSDLPGWPPPDDPDHGAIMSITGFIECLTDDWYGNNQDKTTLFPWYFKLYKVGSPTGNTPRVFFSKEPMPTPYVTLWVPAFNYTIRYVVWYKEV